MTLGVGAPAGSRPGAPAGADRSRSYFAFAGGKCRSQIPSMLGWLGDLGRLFWGLIYWNLRKALFQMRGASGPAPCQHPSDSGLAGRTGCEACIGWRDPARFARVCPLLAKAPDGRRVCSADARAVRPFWGRALLLYAGSAGALALAAVLLSFSAFWAIGYRVPLHVVAWPPAWHRIRLARADYFFRMALRTIASGQVRQSYLALGQAYALDPDNLDAALLLAQYTQFANPDYSDSIYSRLVLGRRGNFENTAQLWLRALLARGDLPSVGGLSSAMLRNGTTHAPAWTQALLFAERMDGDPAAVDQLLAGPGKVPAESRSVLALARDLRGGSAADRARILAIHMGGATTALEAYYSLGRLTEAGQGSAVVSLLDGPSAGMLGPYDRESLRLDACASMGWRVLVRKEIEFLLDKGASVPVATILSGHLVRYPDAENAGRLFELLDQRPMPTTADFAGAHTALMCMAGVNGLDGRMTQEADTVRKMMGGEFPSRERVLDFFRDRSPNKSPSAVLPALPELPLEIVYALTAHYRAGAPGSTPTAGGQP